MFKPGLLVIQLVVSLFCILGLWKFHRLWTGKERILFCYLNNVGLFSRVQYYGLPFFTSAILSVIFLPQLSVIFPNASISCVYLCLGLVITAVLTTIWRPKWLKPDWWRWIEQNHADILPLLQKKSIYHSAIRDFTRWQKL
jgi:hypothetical protein